MRFRLESFHGMKKQVIKNVLNFGAKFHLDRCKGEVFKFFKTELE